MCDVCKAAITNLPEVTPRASSEGASDGAGHAFDEEERGQHHGLHGPYMNDHIPGSADVIFDCIRVCPCSCQAQGQSACCWHVC